MSHSAVSRCERTMSRSADFFLMPIARVNKQDGLLCVLGEKAQELGSQSLAQQSCQGLARLGIAAFQCDGGPAERHDELLTGLRDRRHREFEPSPLR